MDPVVGVSASGAPSSATPVVPLRRNWRFQILWIGSTMGFLGIEVASIGYPLAILAMTGSPAQAGLFAFTQMLAALLLGLPAGAIVDRNDRRIILLVAEGGRALAAVSVAVAMVMESLSFVHLLVVAVVLGAGSAFGGPARMLMVRAVVPKEMLTAALTQEEVRNNAAMLAGPPLGGVLYGLRQLFPFLFSAVTFAFSWLCVLIVRTPRRSTARPSAAAEADDRDGSLLGGVKVLWRDGMLRAATIAVTVLNTAGAPLVLVTVIILQQQSTTPWMIGMAMSGMALGGLAGAPLVGPLHRRLRPGVVLLAVLLMQVPVFIALAVPLGPWWVMGVLFFGMLGVPALGVLIDVLIFRQVPDHQRGRVIAAASTLFGMGAPLGAGAAGLLLQYLSAPAAMLILAAALSVAGVYAATRRKLREATWPPQ